MKIFLIIVILRIANHFVVLPEIIALQKFLIASAVPVMVLFVLINVVLMDNVGLMINANKHKG